MQGMRFIPGKHQRLTDIMVEQYEWMTIARLFYQSGMTVELPGRRKLFLPGRFKDSRIGVESRLDGFSLRDIGINRK